MLACPLFVGFTSYDYVFKRFAGSPTYGLNYIVGSVVVFAVMIACGVWTSVSNWNKYCRSVDKR